jgi:hypothetical protein
MNPPDSIESESDSYSIADLPEYDGCSVIFRLAPSVDTRELVSAESVTQRGTRRGLDRVLAMTAVLERAQIQPLFSSGAENVHREGVRTSLSMPTETPSIFTETHLATFPEERYATEALAELMNDPRIAYAHHPVLHHPLGPMPADPQAKNQFGLMRAGFTEAWQHLDRDDMPPVPVAVIDSGIDTKNGDLAPAVAMYEYGSSGPTDIAGHGTAVCSVLAAGRNTTGLAGAVRAGLYVFKAYPATNTKARYSALEWLAKKNTGGCRVLNYSLGGKRPEPTTERLIKELLAKGIVVVAAMGNDCLRGNPRNQPVYPAAQKGVVAVGAVDHKGKRWPDSQTGDHIWMVAPGAGVLTYRPNNVIRQQSGTSFAAPLVTAAAAMLIRRDPHLSVEDVRQQLARAAEPVNGGWNPEYGHGELNLRRLLPHPVA